MKVRHGSFLSSSVDGQNIQLRERSDPSLVLRGPRPIGSTLAIVMPRYP